MKPRPLHRRVSFWLGLFVACFLAGAWWDSYQRQTLVDVATPHGVVTAERRTGSTWLFLSPGVSPWNFSYAHRRIIPQVDWDDQLASLKGIGIRCLWAPDIIVFFSFVGLWGVWLAWRMRVERRATIHRSLPVP